MYSHSYHPSFVAQPFVSARARIQKDFLIIKLTHICLTSSRRKRLRTGNAKKSRAFFFRSLSLFHGPEDKNSVHVAHGRVAHRCGARPKERRVREMVETDFARHDCRARRRTRAVDRLVGTTETTESER